MAIDTDIVVRKYLTPVAGNTISVDIPASDKTTIKVYLSEVGDLAVQDTDYTVTLNTSTYEDFTIIPTASMRTKIDALVAAGGTDFIVVGRTLGYLSDMTAELAFFRQKIAQEFDKTIMRFQQVADKLKRCISRADNDTGATGTLVLPYSGSLANKALIFDASENLTVSTDDYEDQAVNVAASAAAALASQNAAASSASAASTSEVNAAASAAAAASFVISAAMAPVCSASSIPYATQQLMNGNTPSVALGYTPSNNLSSLSADVNGPVQTIVRNLNNGATASSDIVVNNDLSTDTTYYGDFGMNSSGFTGSGNFNKANAVYLTATSGDLAVGTTTANDIHFIYNNGATDSAFIDSTGFNAVNVLASSSMKLNGHPVWTQKLVTVVTTSGTFTRNTNTQFMDIEAWGGGGGGGGITGALSYSYGGGGGGAGGYSRKTVTAATFGASQTITIGAGGTAAASSAGGSGGQTSVGSLCIAKGGSGGQNGSTFLVYGGSGGASGTGDINPPGASGQNSFGGVSSSVPGAGGNGASTLVGQGGTGALVSTSASSTIGGAGGGYGSGGGGAATNNNAGGSLPGGVGTSGLVIITEYISA